MQVSPRAAPRDRDYLPLGELLPRPPPEGLPRSVAAPECRGGALQGRLSAAQQLRTWHLSECERGLRPDGHDGGDIIPHRRVSAHRDAPDQFVSSRMKPILLSGSQTTHSPKPDKRGNDA